MSGGSDAGVSRGLAFAVAAVCIFAAQDGISRYMAERYPVAMIVMYRYWAFALFAAAFAARQAGGLRVAARTRRPLLQ